MTGTEIEHEVKFLLCAARRSPELSKLATNLINSVDIIKSGEHLLVYYDTWVKDLYNQGSTFRLTLRSKDGVPKNRFTYKQLIEEKAGVRICKETHYSVEEMSFYGKLVPNVVSLCVDESDRYDQALFRQGYIRVKRYWFNIRGIECNLDICKTNKGIYFEELETEDPVTKEWIDFIGTRYGITWQSNVNKYKRTMLVNEM